MRPSIEEMIGLERTLPDRTPMDLRQRAKIFAPFAALTGFESCIRAQEILYEEQKVLSEDQMDILNRKLRNLEEGENITVSYFVAEKRRQNFGRYYELSGKVAFSKDKRKIRIGEKEVDINDFFKLECLEKE